MELKDNYTFITLNMMPYKKQTRKQINYNIMNLQPILGIWKGRTN